MNVYDFDETIYDGESSVEFILHFVKSDPSIIKYFPKVLKVFYLYEKELMTIDDFSGKYGNMLSDYCKSCKIDISSLVNGFWDKRMHKIKPFYKQIQQPDDVIITASPSFMMEEICRRIGVKHLLSTDFDFANGVVKRACFREEKVPIFFEAFPDAVIDNFYTDSMNDKFLFPYSKRVFIVKKDKITEYKGDEVGSKLK